MAFSGELKRTLTAGRAKTTCCRASFLSGFLVGAGTVLPDGTVSANYTDPATLSIVGDYLSSFDKNAEPVRTVGERHVRTMIFTSRKATGLLAPSEPAFPPFRCKNCKGNYMAGLFVGCGRISDPAREWRLEFSCGDHRERLLSVFERLGVNVRSTDRRDERLLYLRNSAEILDFFALMGESDVYFELMNGSIEREIRNGANRLANCEANNIAKAISASDEQVRAIRYLEKHRLMGGLETPLADTARLRLAHPDMTLSQLAAISVPAVSKAGLSHRLKRLCEIADNHRAKKEKEKKGEA